MKSLTGLDATFLYLETHEMPMHVGSFNLCDLPAGFKGSFHALVTEHIKARMHLAPVFSRKLVFAPLDLGHPLWVEADSVDVGFHIRRADPRKKGEAPMSLADAQALCGELHGELIDRDFPLWEFYVFDRIQLPQSMGGKVVGGFFSKIHHAALDGKGGVLLANALLDVTPVPREVAPPDPLRKRKLEKDVKLGKMIGSVFSSSLGQLVKAAKMLPTAASAVKTSLGSSLAKPSAEALAPLNKSVKKSGLPLRLAPQTPFNGGIGTGRSFATATLPLADCKAMGKSVGASFNDFVLWICSTALRDYLSQQDKLPKKSLVAAMPVSLREAEATDATNLGNQVSMTLVELGTHLASPGRRMQAILASTGKVKSSMSTFKGLLPTDYPSLLAPWLVGGAGKMALTAFGKSGLAKTLPMLANVVISNVPGAPVPLYLAGAKFLSFHPLSIILHGLGLNITVQTYDGKVDFGIIADHQALPNPQELADAIHRAFELAQELKANAAAAHLADIGSGKPRKNSEKSVAGVTKPAKLEATPGAKRKKPTDTLPTSKTASKSHAPSQSLPRVAAASFTLGPTRKIRTAQK
jgi:diacylglycerol O-acyltransferase / wax synthase